MGLKAILVSVLAILVLTLGDAARCPTDIAFLVDQSTSITRSLYQNQVIPFLINVVNSLNVANDGDHVSLIRFSSPDSTKTDFQFDFSHDKATIVNKINGSDYDGGSTSTLKALNLAQDHFTSSSARKDAYGKTVAPIAVIVTDGVATDGDAASAAQNLLNKNVHIFAIGVGSLVTKDYLTQITADESRVFNIADGSEFNDALVQDIQKSTSC